MLFVCHKRVCLQCLQGPEQLIVIERLIQVKLQGTLGTTQSHLEDAALGKLEHPGQKIVG